MAPRNRSKTLAETKSRKVATREPQNDRPAVPHVVSVLPINPPAIPGRRHPVKRGQPRAQLELTSTPLYRDNVHVIRGFLQSAECAAWIRWAEAVGFTEARHAASREVAFRDNGRVEVWEPAVAANIWERLREMVPAELDGWRSYGCFEKIRVYRYLQGGQRFGKHVDESCPGSVAGTKTSLTVLIYLNGVERDDNANMHGADDGGGGQPLKGGETVFYRGVVGNSEAARFTPEKGALLWHGHGRRCLVHEALAVSSGVKYVLRTDVLYQKC